MKLGVIVGRFQVPYLHDGHKKLIQHAIDNSDKVLIILGCTRDLKDFDRNPYNFLERSKMIQQFYKPPYIDIIYDNKGRNDLWSEELDDIITFYAIGSEKVTLYHSRDSFKDCYEGVYKTEEVEEIPGLSGTAIRKALADAN